MAIVSQQARITDQYFYKQNYNVGPGSYLKCSQSITQKNVYPFNTSQAKKLVLNPKDNYTNPGPGVYFDQNYEDNDIFDRGLDNKFGSQAKRFEYKKINANPGPGTYYISKQIKTHKPQKYSSFTVERKFINQSIPKITHKTQKLNIQVKNLRNNQTKEQHKEYTKVEIKKQKQKNDWAKNNKPKFKEKEQTELGPGSYDPLPEKQLKQQLDHNFKSNVQREIYKTNDQDFKAKTFETKLNLISFNVPFQDKQKEFLKNILDNPEFQTEQNHQILDNFLKQKKFQFFGSSQHRFNRSEQKTDREIQHCDKINNKINAQTFIKQKRFRYNEAELTPGPAQYQNPIGLKQKLIKKILNGYQGNFGSLIPRFRYNQESEREVEQEVEKIHKQKKKQVIKKQKHFLQDDQVSTQDFQTLMINNSKDEISTFQDDYKTIKKQNIPFFSNQDRFKYKKIEDKANLTYHEMPQLQKSKANMNKSKRFNYQTEKGIGPGHYLATEYGNFNKRTYNVNFI